MVPAASISSQVPRSSGGQVFCVVQRAIWALHGKGALPIWLVLCGSWVVHVSWLLFVVVGGNIKLI